VRCVVITDGDADRIGPIDEHDNVVDSHKICGAAGGGWSAGSGRGCDAAFNTTKILDPHCGEVWA